MGKKLDLARIQASFEDALRRLEHQVWPRIDGFVAGVRAPFGEITLDRLDAGLDLDAEIPDDQFEATIAEASSRLGRAAETVAQAPAIYLVRALQSARGVNDVTIPAGCDPLDPAEIRSAVKRAVSATQAKSVTVLHAAGGQDAFFAALDGDCPPTIHGTPVRFHALVELLDRVVVEDLFPSVTSEDGDATKAGAPPPVAPEDYQQRLYEAAKRSPWYVVPNSARDAQKPFVYATQDRPKVVGPKLAVEWRAELRTRADRTGQIVRVSPSRIQIATVVS